MNVSVVLPALNEEGAIGPVLRSIRQQGPSWEIIVVDDGSTDRTAAIAQEAGAIVIRHALTLGAGRSVKDGIDHAAHETIVMMDADATYPAESIPVLVAKLQEGYDLVVGMRRGKEYWGSPAKMVARTVFRLIAEFATGKLIPDINSGMRAFRKSSIREYFPHLCEGFSLPTTMTLAYFFTGRQVAYMPIPYHKRIGRSKVKIIRDSLRTLQYITESIAYFNPLKLFLMIALFVLFIAALAGWWLMNLALFFIGLFVAVLIFALGLLAHGYVRRR